ncbi:MULTISPECIES: P-type conjugative transfer ATPase TrbB [Vibrio]|uniref:P-type conjugative transfer ATPase TrbB n=1 Tax=Vibrio TaxID=662 RepID=UPI001123D50B|nr:MULTISPECIES: P-type conjugative transfer ATPase TrbB [Vibrio]MDG2676290.1 P-type conjugative transfer ATPase TrbB [Vibrio parahaemolyticus]MDW1542416.1 P-type conjugative transfer ATPase TrbB [Vibrio sp. YT-17]TOA86253.1 P-type conjugative transfer ATPase TrbB [Vibrio parahaemolyticus]HBH7899525.1 P-type conjugative transfer ATPase TrbB [Vibrio parahaemolyticus]
MQPKEPTGSVKDRAKRKLERDMGPELLAIFNDPKTVELMLNPDGTVWVEKLGEDMQCIATLRPAQGRAIIETVAGFHGKEVTAYTPKLEAEFPLDGSRFAGQLETVAVGQGPSFAIRKKAVSIFTLDQYVESGIMSEAQKDALVNIISQKKNILVVGGTGSGKTTLANAIIRETVEQFPNDRFIIIEDTSEIQCAAKNYVQYRTSETVDMTSLLKTALRMRPDRILVGEVRGPEALDLLMAWNTGHPGGVATIHANKGPSSGLGRFKFLISMHPKKPDPIEPFIGEAVHALVYIAKNKKTNTRAVEEIIEVSGYQDGQYLTTTLSNKTI